MYVKISHSVCTALGNNLNTGSSCYMEMVIFGGCVSMLQLVPQAWVPGLSHQAEVSNFPAQKLNLALFYPCTKGTENCSQDCCRCLCIQQSQPAYKTDLYDKRRYLILKPHSSSRAVFNGGYSFLIFCSIFFLSCMHAMSPDEEVKCTHTWMPADYGCQPARCKLQHCLPLSYC